MSDVNVGVRIDLKGDLQQQISRVNGQFDQSLSQLSQQAKDLTTALKQPFLDFEREMIAVKARMLGTSEAQYKQLKEQAKELGASTIFTSTQIAQGMNKLAMAGFDADAIKASMADVTAFVQANGLDFGLGADIATDIGTAFGYQANELGEVLDVLTLGANSANTDIAMLGETMKYCAADAHSLGLSLQETTAMAGILANAGIKGSMAGTTLKETIKALAVPDDAAKKVLQKLNIKVYDDVGKMRDITSLLRDVNDATKDLTQEERSSAIQKIFKERGARGILTIMSQGQDAFEQFLEALQHSAAGTVRRMQDTMTESLAAGLEAINSRKDALFTTITESGRNQLVGIQQLKIGFLTGLNNIAKENSVLSSRISMTTQLLSDIGGVFTSSGAVLSTILSGFTALSMYKNQRAVHNMAQSMTTGRGVLGGISSSQPLPVWVMNYRGGAAGGMAPMPGNALPASIGNGVERGISRAGKKGFWQGKAAYGIKGAGAGIAFGALNMGLEMVAIRKSNLAAEEQEKALKNTFNRNAWGMFGSTAGAVIGSVIAPGIGTAIGGVLGQFAGDWVAGKKEYAVSDAGKYQAFLTEQQIQYNRKNEDFLRFFEKGGWADWLFGGPGTVNDEVDESLATIRKLFAERGDLMPYEQAGMLKKELEEFIDENISTPQMLDKELQKLFSGLAASPYAQQFKSVVTPMQAPNGDIYTEIKNPFIDMLRQTLPQWFKESGNFSAWRDTYTERAMQQGDKFDANSGVSSLLEAYSKALFEKQQGSQTPQEIEEKNSARLVTEMAEIKKISADMLHELKNRPGIYSLGAN